MDDVNTIRNLRGQTNIPLSVFDYRVPIIKGVPDEEKREFIMKTDKTATDPTDMVKLSKSIHKNNELEKKIAISNPKATHIVLKYLGQPDTLPYIYVKPRSWIKRIFNF
tara:strand:- start:144 stop:470 length:327 start_codon:yes stop_codon:yes gene_type:complete